jgi:hypothetical protein
LIGKRPKKSVLSSSRPVNHVIKRLNLKAAQPIKLIVNKVMAHKAAAKQSPKVLSKVKVANHKTTMSRAIKITPIITKMAMDKRLRRERRKATTLKVTMLKATIPRTTVPKATKPKTLNLPLLQ